MPRPRKKELPQLNQQETIGARIAKLRKLNKMTQSDLGELIGISRYQISDYETGRLHLSDDMIIRFAKALNISSDFLLGIEYENSVEKIIYRIYKLPADKKNSIFFQLEEILKITEER